MKEDRQYQAQLAQELLEKFGMKSLPPLFENVKLDDIHNPLPPITQLSHDDIRKLSSNGPTRFKYVILDTGELIITKPFSNFIPISAKELTQFKDAIPHNFTEIDGIRYRFLSLPNNDQILYEASEHASKPLWRRIPIKHPEISGLKPVVFAGDFYVEKGRILLSHPSGLHGIDNWSGHFLCSGKHQQIMVEHVFKRHGFDEAQGCFFDKAAIKAKTNLRPKIILRADWMDIPTATQHTASLSKSYPYKDMSAFVDFFERKGFVTKQQLQLEFNLKSHTISVLMKHEQILKSEDLLYGLHPRLQSTITKNIDNLATINRSKQQIVLRYPLLQEDALAMCKQKLSSLAQTQRLLVNNIKINPTKCESVFSYEFTFHPARYDVVRDHKNQFSGLKVMFDGAKDTSLSYWHNLISQAEGKGRWEEGLYFRQQLKNAAAPTVEEVQKSMLAIQSELKNIPDLKDIDQYDLRIQKMSGATKGGLKNIHLDKFKSQDHEYFKYDPKRQSLIIKEQYVNIKDLKVHQQAAAEAIQQLEKGGSKIVSLFLKPFKYIKPIVTKGLPILATGYALKNAMTNVANAEEPHIAVVQEASSWGFSWLGAWAGAKIGAKTPGNPVGKVAATVGSAIIGGFTAEHIAVKSLQMVLGKPNHFDLKAEAEFDRNVFKAIKQKQAEQQSNQSTTKDTKLTSNGAKPPQNQENPNNKNKKNLQFLFQQDKIKIEKAMYTTTQPATTTQSNKNSSDVDAKQSSDVSNNHMQTTTDQDVKKKEEMLKRIEKMEQELHNDYKKFSKFCEEWQKANEDNKNANNPLLPFYILQATQRLSDSVVSFSAQKATHELFKERNAEIANHQQHLEELTDFRLNLEQFRHSTELFVTRLPIEVHAGFTQSITEAKEQFRARLAEFAFFKQQLQVHDQISTSFEAQIKIIQEQKEKLCHKLRKISFNSGLSFGHSASQLLSGPLSLFANINPAMAPVAMIGSLASMLFGIAEQDDQRKQQKKAARLQAELDRWQTKQQCKESLLSLNKDTQRQVSFILHDLEHEIIRRGSNSPAEFRKWLNDQINSYKGQKATNEKDLKKYQDDLQALKDGTENIKALIKIHEGLLAATSKKKQRKRLEGLITSYKNNLQEHLTLIAEKEPELNTYINALTETIKTEQRNIDSYQAISKNEEVLKLIKDWYHNDKIKAEEAKYAGMSVEEKNAAQEADRIATMKLDECEKEWYEFLKILNHDTYHVKEFIGAAKNITSALQRFWGYEKPAKALEIADLTLEAGKILYTFIGDRKFGIRRFYDIFKKFNDIGKTFEEFGGLKVLFTEFFNPSANLIGIAITLFGIVSGLQPENPIIKHIDNRFKHLIQYLEKHFKSLHLAMHEQFESLNAKSDAHFRVTANMAQDMVTIKGYTKEIRDKISQAEKLAVLQRNLYLEKMHKLTTKQNNNNYLSDVTKKVEQIELDTNKQPLQRMMSQLLIHAEQSVDRPYASNQLAFDPTVVDVSFKPHHYMGYLADKVAYQKKLPNFKIYYASVHALCTKLATMKFEHEFANQEKMSNQKSFLLQTKTQLNQVRNIGLTLKNFLLSIANQQDSLLLTQINTLQGRYIGLCKRIVQLDENAHAINAKKLNELSVDFINQFVSKSYNFKLIREVSEGQNFVGYHRNFLNDILTRRFVNYIGVAPEQKQIENLNKEKIDKKYQETQDKFTKKMKEKKMKQFYMSTLQELVGSNFYSLYKEVPASFFSLNMASLIFDISLRPIIKDPILIPGRTIPKPYYFEYSYFTYAHTDYEDYRNYYRDLDDENEDEVLFNLQSIDKLKASKNPVIIINSSSGTELFLLGYQVNKDIKQLKIPSIMNNASIYQATEYAETGNENKSILSLAQAFHDSSYQYLASYGRQIDYLLEHQIYTGFSFQTVRLDIKDNGVLIFPSNTNPDCYPLVFTTEHLELFKTHPIIAKLYEIEQANKALITLSYSFVKGPHPSIQDEFIYTHYLNYHLHLLDHPVNEPILVAKMKLATFDALTVEAVKKIVATKDGGYLEVPNLNEFLLTEMYGSYANNDGLPGIASNLSCDVTGKGAILLSEFDFPGLYYILLKLPITHSLCFDHRVYSDDALEQLSKYVLDEGDLNDIGMLLSKSDDKRVEAADIDKLLAALTQSNVNIIEYLNEYEAVKLEYDALIAMMKLLTSQSRQQVVNELKQITNIEDPTQILILANSGWDAFCNFLNNQCEFISQVAQEQINSSLIKFNLEPSKLLLDLEQLLANLEFWINDLNDKLNGIAYANPLTEPDLQNMPRRWKPMTNITKVGGVRTTSAPAAFFSKPSQQLPQQNNRVIPTAGGGNCALHAVLGTGENFIVCNNVQNEREKLGKAIRNVNKETTLFDFIIKGIHTTWDWPALYELRNMANKPGLVALQKKYTDFIKLHNQNDKEISGKFTAAIENCGTVIAYLKHHAGWLYPDNDLKKMFDYCINSLGENYAKEEKDPQKKIAKQKEIDMRNKISADLQKIIDANMTFNIAYNKYLEAHAMQKKAKFNWKQEITQQALNEYAAILEKDGEFLFEVEVGQLAYAVNKCIHLEVAGQGQRPPFNPQAQDVVYIQHNGSKSLDGGHYSRMHPPAQPAQRMQM